MITERPILFSMEMVQAILDERKTQTRRVIKPQPEIVTGDMLSQYRWYAANHGDFCGDVERELKPPYGYPGCLLYVREAWKPLGQDPDDGEWIVQYKDGTSLNIGRMWPKEEEYKEIDLSERLAEQYQQKGFMPWKPSIHMPKSASRIWLRVKDVRVERVQEITGQDAICEGIKTFSGYTVNPYKNYLKGVDGEMDMHCSSPVRSFQTLWDSINAKRENGKYSWVSNPWVWVVSFEVISKTGRPEEL